MKENPPAAAGAALLNVKAEGVTASGLVVTMLADTLFVPSTTPDLSASGKPLVAV